MLWNVSTIKGYAIAATDGTIGTVGDFLFDDRDWLVRWLVVDSGDWLSGRKVLLPPSALGSLDAARGEFAVKLTMQQVSDSPDFDSDLPVSRQVESSIYDYYDWNPYWGAGFGLGRDGVMAMAPALATGERAESIADTLRTEDDPHLRGIVALTGTYIHATDGEIGHVENFIIDDTGWSIRYLIVDTGNWWSGETVLISPRSVRTIDWTDRLIEVDVDRQKVKDAPRYNPAITVDGAYDEQFLTYYGIRFVAV
jgi:sporulation protein YlmC with PRC-barrel domain